MNIWHDIAKDRIKVDNFTVLVEIQKGGKVKYELDKETGLLSLDRILYTSMQYPANYGLIPRTLGKDGDPLDALVICSENIIPMTLVQCYPIGMVNMIDSGDRDEKILAIPFVDPMFNNYKCITELPKHLSDEIVHFFRVYKDLENKKTEIKSVVGVAEAKEIIKESIEAYNKIFNK